MGRLTRRKCICVVQNCALVEKNGEGVHGGDRVHC